MSNSNNLLLSLESAVSTMLGASALDPATKTGLQSAISNSKTALIQELASLGSAAVTAVEQPGNLITNLETAGVAAVPQAEAVAGQVVTGLVNAEIGAVAGPLAMPAESLADGLLNWAGGNIEAAITKLLSQHAANASASAAAVVQTGTVTAVNPASPQ